ncbi:MAG: hypothetical protein JW816_00995 [Candidatus Buchananbacteria bacterium]|nr:hypothetical protein [Candidatus Buchananbacteria bacterium]
MLNNPGQSFGGGFRVDSGGHFVKGDEKLFPHTEPTLDLLLERWQEMFKQPGLTSSEFESCLSAIIEKISSNLRVANLLIGANFPVLLPQISPSAGGYGGMITESILPVLSQVASVFDTVLSNSLDGSGVEMTIVEPRHAKLVESLTQGPILGIICFSFRGLTLSDQLSICAELPEEMSLCGVLDMAVFEAIYADMLLLSGGHQHGLDCSAVSVNNPEDGRTLLPYFDFYRTPLSCNWGWLDLNCRGDYCESRQDCFSGLFIRGDK